MRFYNFIDKIYLNYDVTKITKKQIDYNSKSLNENTQSLLSK